MHSSFKSGDKVVAVHTTDPDTPEPDGKPFWGYMLQEEADKIGLVYAPEWVITIVED